MLTKPDKKRSLNLGGEALARKAPLERHHEGDERLQRKASE